MGVLFYMVELHVTTHGQRHTVWVTFCLLAKVIVTRGSVGEFCNDQGTTTNAGVSARAKILLDLRLRSGSAIQRHIVSQCGGQVCVCVCVCVWGGGGGGGGQKEGSEEHVAGGIHRIASDATDKFVGRSGGQDADRSLGLGCALKGWHPGPCDTSPLLTTRLIMLQNREALWMCSRKHEDAGFGARGRDRRRTDLLILGEV